MPCSIAIIHYRQCKHNTLFKLDCTEGCDSLCPPEKQETLLITKYMWRCEDCHYRQTRIDDLARQAKWETAANKVEDEIVDESQTVGPTAEARAARVDGVRAREEHENETLTLTRSAQMDEIDWVEQWTAQYGQLLWDLKYDAGVDVALTDRRKGYLLSVKVWDLLVVKDATRSKEVLNEEIQRYRAIMGGYPQELQPLLEKWKNLEPEEEKTDSAKVSSVVATRDTDLDDTPKSRAAEDDTNTGDTDADAVDIGTTPADSPAQKHTTNCERPVSETGTSDKPPTHANSGSALSSTSPAHPAHAATVAAAATATDAT